MADKYSISIVGAGNLAYNLAIALDRRGHSVNEIFSRNIHKAQRLAGELQDADAVDTLDFSRSQSRVFFLAVTDQAIPEVATQLVLPANSIVAHTSGNSSVSVLDFVKAEKAVFYPLQTFTHGRKLNFEEIPVLIESTSIDAEKVLTEIAVTITRHVYYLNSARRRTLHVAAVFASNFVNHMLTIAKDVLDEEKIEYEMLRALVRETVEKALEGEPLNMQTGPAVRKDENTLKAHLGYLKDKPHYAEIYKLISESIIRRSGSGE
jgi:predicted short-subunit dehydrogenase-like oxidoreductase (DUF2520 family)